MNLPETAKLQEIYGETEISGARFKNLADNFSKIYGQDKAEYFTAPGRQRSLVIIQIITVVK